jgi:hypothetical protein
VRRRRRYSRRMNARATGSPAVLAPHQSGRPPEARQAPGRSRSAGRVVAGPAPALTLAGCRAASAVNGVAAALAERAYEADRPRGPATSRPRSPDRRPGSLVRHPRLERSRRSESSVLVPEAWARPEGYRRPCWSGGCRRPSDRPAAGQDPVVAEIADIGGGAGAEGARANPTASAARPGLYSVASPAARASPELNSRPGPRPLPVRRTQGTRVAPRRDSTTTRIGPPACPRRRGRSGQTSRRAART